MTPRHFNLQIIISNALKETYIEYTDTYLPNGGLKSDNVIQNCDIWKTINLDNQFIRKVRKYLNL